jgi:uncharacterized OB-fold protein
MTGTGQKFIPRPTPETAAWWEGCRKGELLIQSCTQCGNQQFYPRITCTVCMSDNLEWARSSGRGRVLTYTICRRPVSEAYADDVPYVIALVQLEEGPRMMSNIVECDPESITSGMDLEVVFESWTEEITIPQFRPVASAEGQ